MSTVAPLPRPGFHLGSYPERSDRDPFWDATASIYRPDRAWARYHASLRRFRPIILEIEGHEHRLNKFSDVAFKAEAHRLSARLGRYGLTDNLKQHAFALIRVAAARHLGLRHHDAQLAGGWVMLEGKVAEMETGEGKTLTATLTAATAALAGIPVHVITANDYLAQRDAEFLHPLYQALGLSVAVASNGLSLKDRRRAYACDITYTTNKQIAFDYLRDRLTLKHQGAYLQRRLSELRGEQQDLVLRGLCFAIVDEVDSVMIDDARTPLILSRKVDTPDETTAYTRAMSLAGRLQEEEDFRVDPRQRQIELTARGLEHLRELAVSLGGMWKVSRLREDLTRQALTARYLFVRDQHYLIKNGRVEIIDENTGRTMPERAWEQGLHQMIEIAEGCRPTGRRETIARLSYQRFFRRYLRLSGMTGTAREVAGELWSIYRLPVERIPTHRPIRRVRLPARLFPDAAAKWQAVVGSAAELHAQQRPLLIGTRSVAASEHLSRLLTAAGLPHRVLNANQNSEEADIILHAGEPGRITVATNMAGRGTDIPLRFGAAALGGLHVIAAEPNNARRIDRQLFGRCGRQGDPGSFQTFVSLDDELMLHCIPMILLRMLTQLPLHPSGPAHWLGLGLLRLAQWSTESSHRRMRGELLRQDQEQDAFLAFAGQPE